MLLKKINNQNKTWQHVKHTLAFYWSVTITNPTDLPLPDTAGNGIWSGFILREYNEYNEKNK